VYPAAQEIHQYRRDQPNLVQTYRGAERLDTSAFFPTLELRAAQVFV
jgi:hypothetical protein